MISFLRGWFGGGKPQTRAVTSANFGMEVNTPAGVFVTETTALHNTAVLAAVRCISETLASLPLVVYQREGRGKSRATAHPLYRLLHDEPNEQMTSFTFRETLTAHALTWGNAYAYVERDANAIPTALLPLLPDRTRPERRDKRLVYVTHVGGKAVDLLPHEVLHVPGLGWDGTRGYSVIGMIRNAVAISQAAEEFGARFFNSDGNAGAVLTHPAVLSPEAQQNLRTSVAAASKPGISSAFRVLVLQEGMKWERIGMPPEDGQFLETRQFQVAEIARAFRVPPHMIGDLSRATFSNIEQQSIDFVTHSIRPWAVRFEQELNRKLLAADERDTHYVEHVVDGLLRGDSAARAQALSTRLQNGTLTPNEWRELENMNPVEGGDTLYINGAMVPVSQLGKPPADDPTTATQPDDEEPEPPEPEQPRAAEVLAPVVIDVLTRLTRRDAKAVENAAAKYAGDDAGLTRWVEKYADETRTLVVDAITPVARTLSALGVELDAAAHAEAHVTAIRSDVTDYLGSTDVTRPEVLARIVGGMQDRAARTAKTITGGSKWNR